MLVWYKKKLAIKRQQLGDKVSLILKGKSIIGQQKHCRNALNSWAYFYSRPIKLIKTFNKMMVEVQIHDKLNRDGGWLYTEGIVPIQKVVKYTIHGYAKHHAGTLAEYHYLRLNDHDIHGM